MKPTKGQKIYVPTSLYVYRGADDFIGGVATIKDVEYSKTLPEGHYNYTMVSIEERPGVQYNWMALIEKQDKLKEEFGQNKCYPDPDLDPEFNDSNEGWR